MNDINKSEWGFGSLDRREFLKRSSAAAMALAFPASTFMKGATMGVVVHSYWSRWNSKTASSKYPAFTNALELLDHCHAIGAGGIQVGVSGWTPEFTKQVRTSKEKSGMYLEGSISLPQTEAEIEKFEREVLTAKEAGATILRTVASSGRRYEVLHSEQAFLDAKQKAIQSLQWAEPVVRKNKMKIAVENHKDWLVGDMVGIIKKIGSESVGVTLDFGNSIALLENPMDVVTALAPYAFSTHVKDMAVEKYADGFLLSEVPLGKGFLDIPKLVAICRQHNKTMKFSLEMITRDPLEIPCLKDDYWSTMSKSQRAGNLSHMLKTVEEHQFSGGLPRVSSLSYDDKLALEEQNIVACLNYSKNSLTL